MRRVIFPLIFLFFCGFISAAVAQTPQQLFNDAMAKQKAGDLDGAVQEYRQLLKVQPDAVAIRSNLGAALAGLGQFAEAITEYNIALQASSLRTWPPPEPCARLLQDRTNHGCG